MNKEVLISFYKAVFFFYLQREWIKNEKIDEVTVKGWF